MRPLVRKLIGLGRIPHYEACTEETLNEYGDLLDSIDKPVTDEEAMALVKLLSPDNAGGINWTIVHLVESAPNWPLQTFLREQTQSEFVQILIKRAKNGGLWLDE